MEKLTNTQFANVLRAIAQVYEENAAIPQMHSLTEATEFIFCHSKEEFTATVRAFGGGRKSADDEGLEFFPEIAAGTSLKIYGFKARCCERVQVGTKTIPAHGEIVIPASPERVEPVYEWRCAPFLDAPIAQAVEA